MNLKDHGKSKLSLGFNKAACANDLYIAIIASYTVGRNKISCLKQLTSEIQVSNAEIAMNTLKLSNHSKQN